MTTPSFARCLFEHWQVRWKPLPTLATEQSDFLVTLGRSKFLIEEKTKLDDPEYISARERDLSEGKVHFNVKALVRTNRLSGIVRKGTKQLAASGASYQHDFALIWFTATGVHATPHYHQFIATLYGTTRIIEMNSQGLKPCYFFRNSEFHRHSALLDGAVVAYVKEGQLLARLCLHPLSPRFERLKRTKFAGLFGTAIENPRAAERNGVAFILGTNTDRANEQALLQDLQSKYNTRPLMKFDLGFTSAAVAVATNEA